MRSAGDHAVGHARGRRHGSAGRNAPSRLVAPLQPGGRDSSLFARGYQASQAAAAQPEDDPGRHGTSRGPGSGGKGPVRGYPPAPGQAAPPYPAGEFYARNRTSLQSAADLQGRCEDSGLVPAGSASWPGGAAAPGYPSANDPANGSGPAGGRQARQGTSGWAAGHWPISPDSSVQRQAAGFQATVAGPDRGAPGRPRAAGRKGGRRASPARRLPGWIRGQGTHGNGTHGAGTHGNGTHGAGRRSSGRTRGRGSPRWLLAACVTVVLTACAIGFLAISGSSGQHSAVAAKGTAVGSASPRTATPTPSLSPWGHIATRLADPAPLTLPELFPPEFTAAGTTYRLAIARQGSRCWAAVIGTALQRAVRRAGCTQVMRASYLSAASKLMGTIGVLNLQSFTRAEQAGKTAGRARFIAQLPSVKGPARKLGTGTGIEEADAKGHYLILVWGESTSLRPPQTATQRSALEAFLRELVNNTANLNLTSRMVDGTPSTTSSAAP